MSQISATPAPQPRISQKLRKAIELRVRKGLTVAAACEDAGMSQSGYFAAMKKTHVREFYENAVAQFVQESDGLRARAKIIAIQQALELMRTAKSETVKARMVEFLAGDTKAPTVSVNVDARAPARGYEYPIEGSQVVELRPPTRPDEREKADKGT